MPSSLNLRATGQSWHHLLACSSVSIFIHPRLVESIRDDHQSVEHDQRGHLVLFGNTPSQFTELRPRRTPPQRRNQFKRRVAHESKPPWCWSHSGGTVPSMKISVLVSGQRPAARRPVVGSISSSTIPGGVSQRRPLSMPARLAICAQIGRARVEPPRRRGRLLSNPTQASPR